MKEVPSQFVSLSKTLQITQLELGLLLSAVANDKKMRHMLLLLRSIESESAVRLIERKEIDVWYRILKRSTAWSIVLYRNESFLCQP